MQVMTAALPINLAAGCSLCDFSNIQPPIQFDPTDFSPHGCHIAVAEHAMLGEAMYAMLRQNITHDVNSLLLDIDDLSDTPTLKVAMDRPE